MAMKKRHKQETSEEYGTRLAWEGLGISIQLHHAISFSAANRIGRTLADTPGAAGLRWVNMSFDEQQDYIWEHL